jgi:hypothetical protein
MGESRLFSPPVSAPRKCRPIANAPEYDADHAILQLPQYIPYNMLGDSIVWLDIFANERDLLFTRDMVRINRLIIFDAASSCIDFVECQTIPSVVVSGMYVSDTKVINQLLEYNSVEQICLIVDKCLYRNLPDLFLSNEKINVIYNNDPDMVIRRFCDDYSNFNAFIRHKYQPHTSANNLLNRLSIDSTTESTNPTMTSTLSVDLEHRRLPSSSSIQKKDIKSDDCTVPHLHKMDLSTNNDTFPPRSSTFWTTDEARIKQSDELDVEIDNHASRIPERGKRSNIPLLSATPCNRNDKPALEELDRIEKVRFFTSFS